MLNKLNDFVDKIGKQNVILIIFIIILIGITALYQTFSLYTASEGMSIVDGIKTYKFILNASNDTNSVTIAANSSKYVAITVSNEEKMNLKYGIYYFSSDDLTDVDLGYLSNNTYLPNGIINTNENRIINIKIYNDSNSNVTINFGVSYGFENGGDLNLPEGKSWLSEVFNRFLLNEAPAGSYVAYVGNNGCVGKSCEGQNANYVSDTNMGYCSNPSSQFTVNGWRIIYIQNNTAYLVSAGALECFGTNDEGDIVYDGDGDPEVAPGTPKHIANLNTESLKYCNSDYVYGNVCNSNSVRSINNDDFFILTNNNFSLLDCYEEDSDECLGTNDLISNGNFYWFAFSPNKENVSTTFTWSSYFMQIKDDSTVFDYGLRPVIRLASNIAVTGGSGTYENPYTIVNNS